MSQSSNDASVPEEKTESASNQGSERNSQESDDITKPMRNLGKNQGSKSLVRII